MTTLTADDIVWCDYARACGAAVGAYKAGDIDHTTACQLQAAARDRRDRALADLSLVVYCSAFPGRTYGPPPEPVIWPDGHGSHR